MRSSGSLSSSIAPLARFTTLTCRPFAYILLTYYLFLITLRVAYVSHRFILTFHTLNFQPPSPAGQAGEASRLKFTNFKTSHNFSGGKGLKTGGGVKLAGLPAPPTSHTLYIYPFHPSHTFPLTKLYCWKLRNSP